MLSPHSILAELKSFPQKQWYGIFPLTISYWGGGAALFLEGRLLNFAFGSLSKLAQWLDAPLLTAVFIVAFKGLLIFLIFVWTIGVWRSSRNEAETVWSSLARISACAFSLILVSFLVMTMGPQLGSAISDFQGDPQQGPRGVRVLNQRELEIFGYLTRDVRTAFKKTIEAHPEIAVVRLNSPGGRVDAARNLRNDIRSRNLDTVVLGKCISACTIAFLGGTHRAIGARGKIGFHAPSDGISVAASTSRELQQEAIDAGVTPTFARKAYGNTQIWFPSIATLESGGVITPKSPHARDLNRRDPSE